MVVTQTEIVNRDGLNLKALLTTPEKLNMMPFVIMVHGFTGGKNEVKFTSLAVKLASVGIGSLRYDAAGIGDSQGDLNKDYRYSQQVLGLDDVYKFVQKLDFVDVERIGLVGHSMGGQVVLDYATNHAEPKVIVACQSVIEPRELDVVQERLEAVENTNSCTIITSQHRELVFYREFFDDWLNSELSSHLKNILQPTLLIAGGRDRSVPPGHVRKASELIPASQYIEFEDATHSYDQNPEALEQINQTITTWLLNNL